MTILKFLCLQIFTGKWKSCASHIHLQQGLHQTWLTANWVHFHLLTADLAARSGTAPVPPAPRRSCIPEAARCWEQSNSSEMTSCSGVWRAPNSAAETETESVGQSVSALRFAQDFHLVKGSSSRLIKALACSSEGALFSCCKSLTDNTRCRTTGELG